MPRRRRRGARVRHIGGVAAPAAGAEIKLGAHIGARTFDHRGEPAHQGLDRDRLGDELVDAGVARLAHPRRLGMAGEHDHRHERIGRLAIGAELAGEFDARHAFHHPIQQHHIGILPAQDGPGALAALGLEQLHRAEGLKNREDEFAHMDVVVHHEEFSACRSDSRSRPPLVLFGSSEPYLMGVNSWFPPPPCARPRACYGHLPHQHASHARGRRVWTKPL